MKFLLFSILLTVLYIEVGASRPRVVCYWANWGGMQPEEIDPTLCTHIHYAFHVMDDVHNVIIDAKGWPQEDIYRRLEALKQKNKDIKIIASVGGWGHPDIKFSRVVNNVELRKGFIKNTIAYLQKYKFDGFDLDWEYPVCWTGNCSAGPPSDRPNFGIFIKEIKEAFDKLTPRLSLSAAVVAGADIADKSYDYKALGEALDYVNVMTYDLAPLSDGKTAHHSKYNVCVADVEDYVNKGVPKDKVLMGQPFYGHSFQLKDISRHEAGAPIIGEGKEDGVYRHVCQLVKNQGWIKEQSDKGHDPFAYKGDEWIGYDDPYAAYEKAKWVRDNGYGGIIIWEISHDDYKKECCSQVNPLLHALNYGLYGTGQSPDTYGSNAIVLFCISIQLSATKQKVVCYWPNWRGDSHKPENIDPTLCTHLHHAFHVLDENHNVIRDSDGPQPDIYRRLHELKKRNPELKVIISLGGGGQPDAPYSRLISDEGRRQQFINNTIAYLHKYQFDGLDVDWEYPVCWSGDCSKGPKSDKPNFGIFLKELRAAFDKQSPRLSLSAAVVAGVPGGTVDHAYDFASMASALDYISVMTYDEAGVWEHMTGHHSKFTFCISASQYYVNKGIPKEKVLMGIPFYGHTFKLADKNKHYIGAPITGEGRTPHGEGDNAWYSEMCELVKKEHWTKETPDDGHDPIAYHDYLWVGYDDPYAALDKSKWVKDNGFGGVIIWEITQDDYHPNCCSVAYPMLRAINYGLYGTGQAPQTYGCEHK
ncbi:probable chitinase 10 [Oppia nitens]|uniref:probable chitinase 10 n=1 Tax=Oppia nitens TaxID=1686743 RepID=UPI0023DA2DAA|nr:probable chitinase 10 [Oppia nitens]